MRELQSFAQSYAISWKSRLTSCGEPGACESCLSSQSKNKSRRESHLVFLSLLYWSLGLEFVIRRRSRWKVKFGMMVNRKEQMEILQQANTRRAFPSFTRARSGKDDVGCERAGICDRLHFQLPWPFRNACFSWWTLSFESLKGAVFAVDTSSLSKKEAVRYQQVWALKLHGLQYWRASNCTGRSEMVSLSSPIMSVWGKQSRVGLCFVTMTGKCLTFDHWFNRKVKSNMLEPF